MKFLVDMNLPPCMAEWISGQGHEAVHASILGMATSPDQEILERGRKEGWIVVTADLDFPRLLSQMRADGPGLILFRGGNLPDSAAKALLLRIFNLYGPDLLFKAIVVAERGRIRFRRLPIR